ncbi:MAG TPA: TraR/DksA family transcriptional regulator [Burkholderiaceae bacterium]|nr:TraR/DksA family transcriptional regulator [Burkholderiaceae bacterium]
MTTSPDTTLTQEQITEFSQRLAARKALLMEEISEVANRSQSEFDVQLISRSGDSGAAAASDLLRGIAEAEITRDIVEVRDIVAAEQRIETGRYGVCISCEGPIRYKRLDAYPTAKRCYSCQVEYEEGRQTAR